MEKPTCATCVFWGTALPQAAGPCMFEPLLQIDSNGFFIWAKTGKHQFCSRHPGWQEYLDHLKDPNKRICSKCKGKMIDGTLNEWGMCDACWESGFSKDTK